MRILFFIFYSLFFFSLSGQHCLFKQDDMDSFSLLKKELSNIFMEVEQRGISTIPVVFHIVWNDEEQNISDVQIQSQLDALNRDYRKRNIEIDKLFHSTGIEGADVEIEFCLATKYEEDKEILGIIRKNTAVEKIGLYNDIFFSQEGGSSAWDTKQYLNVWICDLPEGILGYSSSPSDYGHPKDGIVVSYRYFGTLGTATRPYHLGRTLTHEVGHYLGLHHTWGAQEGDCTGDDGIEDTPAQAFAYYGCPTIPQISCESEDYFFNFMNFVDDECLSMFTQHQKEKMQYCLHNIRTELTSQESCANLDFYEKYESPTIFPNPTKGNINIIWNEQFEANLDLYCYSFSGTLLFKKQIQAKRLSSFYLDTHENLLLFIFRDEKGNCVHKQKVVVL